MELRHAIAAARRSRPCQMRVLLTCAKTAFPLIAYAEFGDAIVNKKSATWRGFDDATRAMDPLELVTLNPTVMKRPLIVDDQGALALGWGKDVQERFGV